VVQQWGWQELPEACGSVLRGQVVQQWGWQGLPVAGGSMLRGLQVERVVARRMYPPCLPYPL
jgi:hypothetical protein